MDGRIASDDVLDWSRLLRHPIRRTQPTTTTVVVCPLKWADHHATDDDDDNWIPRWISRWPNPSIVMTTVNLNRVAGPARLLFQFARRHKTATTIGEISLFIAWLNITICCWWWSNKQQTIDISFSSSSNNNKKNENEEAWNEKIDCFLFTSGEMLTKDSSSHTHTAAMFTSAWEQG